MFNDVGQMAQRNLERFRDPFNGRPRWVRSTSLDPAERAWRDPSSEGDVFLSHVPLAANAANRSGQSHAGGLNGHPRTIAGDGRTRPCATRSVFRLKVFDRMFDMRREAFG